MKKLIATAALLACPLLAMADNYAECLLDKLPGVENQTAAVAAIRLCKYEYPKGLTGVEQGSGRGLFASYSSGDECSLEKAKETRNSRAARLIASACYRLYNKPTPPESTARESCETSSPGPWCSYR